MFEYLWINCCWKLFLFIDSSWGMMKHKNSHFLEEMFLMHIKHIDYFCILNNSESNLLLLFKKRLRIDHPHKWIDQQILKDTFYQNKLDIIYYLGLFHSKGQLKNNFHWWNWKVQHIYYLINNIHLCKECIHFHLVINTYQLFNFNKKYGSHHNDSQVHISYILFQLDHIGDLYISELFYKFYINFLF